MKAVTFCSVIFLTVTFVASCGGGPAGNVPANNSNSGVSSTSQNANAVTVITPTPDPSNNDAPTLTPVYKAFCEALKKKDEPAVRKVYSSDTLKNFDEQMKAENIKSLLKFLEDDIPTGECTVKNEVINGDSAVAKLVSSLYPNGFAIVFVKEGGEWKMTNRSPTLDTVKSDKTAPANAAK